MNDVAVIGVGLHPFGRFDKSAMQMGADAPPSFHAVRIDNAHFHAADRRAVAVLAEWAEQTNLTDAISAEAHAKSRCLVLTTPDGGAVGHAGPANM